MTEEEVAVGPLVYAFLKGVKAYREAYREAVGEYKSLTGKDAGLSDELAIKKIFSVVSDVEKSSDLSLREFLKNYQKFELLFSLAKTFLG